MISFGQPPRQARGQRRRRVGGRAGSISNTDRSYHRRLLCRIGTAGCFAIPDLGRELRREIRLPKYADSRRVSPPAVFRRPRHDELGHYSVRVEPCYRR